MLLTHSIISVDLNNFGVLTVHNTSLLPVHAIVYTAVLYFCFIMKKPVLVVAVLEWLLDEDRVCIGESTELSYLLDQRLMSDVLREKEIQTDESDSTDDQQLTGACSAWSGTGQTHDRVKPHNTTQCMCMCICVHHGKSTGLKVTRCRRAYKNFNGNIIYTVHTQQ